VWRDHICGLVGAESLADALGYVGTPAFDACLSPPFARTPGATPGP
jgi:hypothetical protein